MNEDVATGGLLEWEIIYGVISAWGWPIPSRELQLSMKTVQI